MIRWGEAVVGRRAKQRSRLGRFVLLAALTVASSGCATNPATGKSQLNFYSEAEEIQMGREADREIAAEMGILDDPQLQSYVQELGSRLAALSERPHLPWTFKVMDDPAVNAFALPGGYIYVTRGILGHLTSEAELSGVIGHEIGHVTAQHGVNQLSKQQLAVGSLVLGMIAVPELEEAEGLAELGLGALFLKYSRDDERQADDLGLRYMAATGYEVRELPKVFALLGKVSAGEGGGRLPNWLSSHPDPGAREARTDTLIAERSYPAGKLEAASYLRRLDGLPYGPDPRQGYFENGVFYHPGLALELRFPPGWKASNELTQVVAMHPDEIAMVQLLVSSATSAAEAARTFLAEEGISGTAQGRPRLHGLTAEHVDFSTSGEGTTLWGRAYFFERSGSVLALVGVAEAARWREVGGAIDSALSSLAPLTDAARLEVSGQRLEIVRLPQTMSFDDFLQRYPSTAPPQTIALINAVEDPTRSLAAGSLMKRVVGRRFGDAPQP